MDMGKFFTWMKELWFVWITLLTLILFLILAQSVGGYSQCHARWGTSFKKVEYHFAGGCLIEYPDGSGKMIPEEAIRILEEPIDQKKDNKED